MWDTKATHSIAGGQSSKRIYVERLSQTFDWDNAIARFHLLMEEVYGKRRK